MAKEYGSPCILKSCRPGGLGNHKSRIDQGQLYHDTGEKAANGIKHLGAFFPNGMMAVFSPNFSI
jgi:hypothetical protein